MKPYYIGFDADTAACGLVVFHRGKIVKIDDVEKAYLESWLIEVKQMAAGAPVIARVEMPTLTTAIGCGQKIPANMHVKFGFDCGRCHEVAELMVDLCRRPHLNFTVEIVLSDHRIRCDKLIAKNKAALVTGLSDLRGKKWGNGKTSKTYPSKWTKSKAALIFPDLLNFKNVSADALDALGLLYDLGLETYSPR